jgi:hypothetical protein
MTTDGDDVMIALTKLRLQTDDSLLVSAPEGWCVEIIKEYEKNFRKVGGAALAGV